MWKLSTLAIISAVIGITTLPTYAADTDGPQARGAGSNYRVFSPAPQQHDAVRTRGPQYDRELARYQRQQSRERREHNRYERGPVQDGHRGHDHGPPARTGFQWIPGSWDLQVEEICVEPERWEWQYVPAVTETRYTACGEPYVVVIKPACKERVLIPARYETHQKRVWIPGRWDPVERCITPVPVTRPHYGRSSGFSFGFSF